MKQLYLKNNYEIEIEDESVIFDVAILLNNSSELLDILDHLSKDNVSKMRLVDGENETVYDNYVLSSYTVTVDDNRLHLYFSEPLQGKEQELQNQVTALVEANASLEAQVSAMQDKAMAADIMFGGDING